MKFVAAYLLAVLAGNPSPSAEDLSAILESGKMFHFKDRNGSYVSLTISSALLTEKTCLLIEYRISPNGVVYVNWQFKKFKRGFCNLHLWCMNSSQ
jgi:hypothetical protein